MSNPATNKVTPILMPELGNTMEEGTIVAWKKEVGSQIEAGEILCEIETDKAVTEYECPHAGRLARIVAEVGEFVGVREPIAYLAASDAELDEFLAESPATPAQKTASAGQPIGPPASFPDPSTVQDPISNVDVGAGPDKTFIPALPKTSNRVAVSPAAKMLAAERGIDLSTIRHGSGPHGRIISADVTALPTKGGQTTGRATPTWRQTSAATSQAQSRPAGNVTRNPMSKMRSAIAGRLQESKQTVPHFYMRLTIDADALYSVYQSQKKAIGCSLNDLLVWACGQVLDEYPDLRSRVAGNEILEYADANIGIAVDVPGGLVVPVITAVQKRSVQELATESKRVITLAKTGKVENVGQGVFTISNLGMLGVEEFSAIINPPEAAILAIGALRDGIVNRGGAAVPCKQMTMTLSADHRVVDGATAARFLRRLKELLEGL